MISIIEKIIGLSQKRISYFHTVENVKDWYQGSTTYVDWIKNEIEEVEEEIKNKKYIYLEDELGDVFWDYCCLLESLEQEWKIVKSRVFDRCYQKFSERIGENADAGHNWDEVKVFQKERLQKEQEAYYSL